MLGRSPWRISSNCLLITMSSASSSRDATSLPSPKGEYEVFLSFRGPDSRHKFTDVLSRFLIRSKIRTYVDEDRLVKGEEIWPNLVRAIHQSKISIPIFSEDYAGSKWCLNELVEMIEHQKREKGHIIIPVFYNVKPNDVRHQTGPYEEPFRQHEKKHDKKTIQSWKDALEQVGYLKGWPIKEGEMEGSTADLITGEVWSHLLKHNDALETGELVGIDDHVEEVKCRLSLDSDGVSVVGLHGMGGIGKTTIATAVYNEISTCFERYSFVEDIRETQKQRNGVLAIQKKLISNILRTNSETIVDVCEAKKIIKERISQFKILVVLDDVDENFNFKKLLGNLGDFVSGSRFIITSRNIKVLKRLSEDPNNLYQVEPMDLHHSLQLFSEHAFKKDSPPPGFEVLSKDIVSTTGGLPLTLKVIGSHLFLEEEAVWKDKLEQLREIPEKDVMNRLRISYDGLEYEAKQIFLDIACFCIGKDKETATYMWSDCHFHPVSNINILIQKSILKIGYHNEFQLHDQLRDMGRYIVREENIKPWLRSRIWSDDHATELLLNHKDTSQVKAIRVNSSSSSPSSEFCNEYFSYLPELRYLEANYTTLTGDFRNLLPSLKWLRLRVPYPSMENHHGPWRRSRKLKNLHMKNLIIFDVANSKVGDDWGGWSHIKEARKLKVLNLSNCDNLRKVPELPESGSLEMLDLSNNFAKMDEGAELNLRNLQNLKVAKLQYCKLGKIKGGTIGTKMKGLQELDLTRIEGDLDSMRRAISDIGNLSSLKILKVNAAYRTTGTVHGLLEGIKLPKGLKVLITSSSVANLHELGELEELMMIQSETGLLIPKPSNDHNGWSWSSSSKLKSLVLSSADIVMANNNSILPSNLTRLCITDLINSEQLPNLSNLGSLITLQLQLCPELREIHGFEGLKSLQNLEIRGTGSLTRLDGLGNLMSCSDCNLESLRIQGCPKLYTTWTYVYDDDLELTKIESLEVKPVKIESLEEKPVKIESLREMFIDGCPMLDGWAIPHLSRFPNLKTLHISGISDQESSTLLLLEGVEDMEELVHLELGGFDTVKRLPSISKLSKLRHLALWEIPCLKEIEGLGDLKSLRVLTLGGCTSLERLPIANLYTSMDDMKLDLRGCTNFAATDLSPLIGSRFEATINWPQEHVDPQL